MFQKILTNKHLLSHDSQISLIEPSGGLGFSTRQQKTKRSVYLQMALFKKNGEVGYWKGIDFISAEV